MRPNAAYRDAKMNDRRKQNKTKNPAYFRKASGR